MNLFEMLVAVMLIGTTGGVVFAAIDGWKSVRLGPPKDPEALLRHMLVRGEIDEAQYEKRVALLRYGPPLEI